MIRLFSLLLFYFSIIGLSFSQEVYFTENKGQIIDQNQKQVKNVLYNLSTNGYNVSFYKDHFSYEIFESSKENVKSNRIEIWFNQSNNSKISAHLKVKEVLNYYKENISVKNITQYKKLLYKNVWKGIDIEFMIQNNQLKYNYIISPEAPNLFSLAIRGSKIKFKNNTISYYNGTSTLFTESIPKVYWEKDTEKSILELINTQVIENNIIYNIPKDRNENLIIDPLAYGEKQTTYYGGIHVDYIHDIETNSLNEVIIVGYTLSLNNIATTGAYQQYINDVDSYIAKFDATGNRMWATYFGGGEYERSYSFAIDNNDNIILSGNTTSIFGVSTPGALQTTLNGTDDSFIAKFSTSGQLIWSTYFGGSEHDFIRSITTDQNNNILFTGHTLSPDYPMTIDAHNNVFSNSETCYISSLTSSGTLLHSSYVSNGESIGRTIKTDDNGNIYLAGSTISTTGISYGNSYQPIFNGNDDGFIIKFNTTYQPDWGTYFGGNNEDQILGLSITNSNLYIVGNTNSSLNIADANSFQPQKAILEDGFIASFDLMGNKEWSTYVGGNGTDYFTDLAVVNNEIWTLGYSTSSNLLTDSSSIQRENAGDYDISIHKFTTSGAFEWATYKGGSGNDVSTAISILNSSSIFISGYTGSFSSFSTPNAHQIYHGGNSFDGFWSNICKPIQLTTLSEIDDTISFCQGSSITLSSTNLFNSYLWNNGNSSNAITIEESGDYWLTTIDANGCPGRSDTLTVVVHSDTAIINSSSTILCDSDSILLSVPTGYSQYIWSNNNDNQNQQYITSLGDYWLSVIDTNGCTYQSDTTTIINSNQHIPVNILGTPIICSGGSATLYINPSSLANYNWNNGETTPSITINSPGLYSITGTNSGGCPITSDTVEIIVSNYQNENVSLDTSGIIQICSTDSFTITVNEIFDSYLWSNNTTNNNTTVYDEGVYFVSVIDSNNCSSISDSIWITYFPETVSSIIYNLDTICEGDSVLFQTSQNVINPIWNNGLTSDSLWVYDDNIYHYVAIDNNNCLSNSDSVNLFIHSRINPTVNLIQNQYLCTNETTLLSSDYGVVEWNTNYTTDTLNITNNGTYSFKYYDSTTTCTWNSDSLLIELNAPLTSTITPSLDVYCLNETFTLAQLNPSDFISYNWDNQSTSNSYAWIADTSKTIKVQLVDKNNCSVNDSIFIDVINCEVFTRISPNPAKGVLKISSSKIISSFSISNKLGQIVYQSPIINNTETNFDSSFLSSGSYLFNVDLNDELKIIKVMVIN